MLNIFKVNNKDFTTIFVLLTLNFFHFVLLFLLIVNIVDIAEKYIVLWAGMGWENLQGYMFSSLFTPNIKLLKDKFSQQCFKNIR